MFSFVGRSVRIIGDHPHSGETGVVSRIEATLAGPGLRVSLDNYVHGTQEYFVFKTTNLKLIGMRVKKEFDL